MYWTAVLVSLSLAVADPPSRCTTPSRRPGDCISILNCRQYSFLLQGSVGSSVRSRVIALVEQSGCGFKGSYPLVCCPTEVHEELVSHSAPTKLKSADVDVDDVSGHHNLHLVNSQYCGRSQQNRIFMGSETQLFEFPWMVLLNYNVIGNSFLCDGSLISTRYVMTAAHCIKNTGFQLISVRLGEHDTSKRDECDGDVCKPTQFDVFVQETFVHPEYNKDDDRFLFDVALIRMVKEVDITSVSVQPICLPVNKIQLSAGKKVFVAGWGRTETGFTSDILLKVSLPVVDIHSCADVYNQVKGRNMNISNSQICAGGQENHADSCNGDSGAPLMAVGLVDKEPRFVQYGIVSYGSTDCGVVNEPGVYTNVVHYIKWILDTMRE